MCVRALRTCGLHCIGTSGSRVCVCGCGSSVSQLRIPVNARFDYVYIGDWVALLFTKLQFDAFVISRICNFTIEFLAIYTNFDDVDLLFRYFFILVEAYMLSAHSHNCNIT